MDPFPGLSEERLAALLGAREYYDTHDLTKEIEMAETDFPDRNLDVLHERVASGKPTQEQEDTRRGRSLRAAEELLVAHGGGSLTLVLDEAGDWAVVVDLGDVGSNGYGASAKNAIDDAVVKAGG